MNEFVELLKEKSVDYEVVDKGILITGDVDLSHSKIKKTTRKYHY